MQALRIVFSDLEGGGDCMTGLVQIRIIYKRLNMCNIDCTDVIGEIWPLTTPVG